MYEENSSNVDKLVHLYVLYVDGAFNRRELVRRIAKHTGSIAAAFPLPLFAQGITAWCRIGLLQRAPPPEHRHPGISFKFLVLLSTRAGTCWCCIAAHIPFFFDPTGKFIRSWGDGMFSEERVAAVAPGDRANGASGYSAVYGPAGCDSCGVHSIRLDAVGNIWVVDAPGHVVYKMDPRGKVLLQLGLRGVPGMSPTNLNLPADVAFASNGDVYVSEGYGNARVVKYSRDGKYLLHWGKRGSGPGEFQLPHKLVVDARDRVYVTDRDNRRVEVFDAKGKFLTGWRDTGGVSALAITGNQHIWTGGVLRSLDGKPIARVSSEVPRHMALRSATRAKYTSPS